MHLYARIEHPVSRSGEWEEITDLYWFEEHGVHDWEGAGGNNEQYEFKIVIVADRMSYEFEVSRGELKKYKFDFAGK